MAGQLNAAAIAVILTRATEVVRSIKAPPDMPADEIIADLRYHRETIALDSVSVANLVEAMRDGGVDPFAPEFKRPDG